MYRQHYVNVCTSTSTGTGTGTGTLPIQLYIYYHPWRSDRQRAGAVLLISSSVVMPSQRDFSSMSNAYLKTLITERGYSTAGLLTREELLERAEEAAATPDLPPLDPTASSSSSQPLHSHNVVDTCTSSHNREFHGCNISE